MDKAATPGATTVEQVLGDEQSTFDPSATAEMLCKDDPDLTDLLVRGAASPLLGARIISTDAQAAAKALGPLIMRHVVLWAEVLRELETCDKQSLDRAVVMAALAVGDLANGHESEEVAHAITLGLCAELGSARLRARLGQSPMADVIRSLAGPKRTRFEHFVFGTAGTAETKFWAKKWSVGKDLVGVMAPEEGSQRAFRQEALAQRLSTLDDDLWGLTTQVGQLLGHKPDDLMVVKPSTPKASALAMLSQFLGHQQADFQEDEAASTFVRSALELSGDPRFIWATTEQTVSAASRFHLPLCVLVIGCSTTDAADQGKGQVATFQAVRNLVRSSDHIGLLDPGHFLVLLPGTTMSGARILAERMGQRLLEAAKTDQDVLACSPHFIYATSLNQETAQQPTAQQLVQTALNGLSGLRTARDQKRVGWNNESLSIFRRG